MTETTLLSPFISVIYFLLITLCFAGGTIFLIKKTLTKESASSAADSTMYNIIYVSLIVFGIYFINVTISKAMCSGPINWGHISLVTLLPWLIIFLSLYFVLTIFPGWANPFSNTIGYVVIGFLGVDKIYANIFKTGNEVSGNPELVKAIANMNSNRPNFVNQISTDVDEFADFFKNIKDALKETDITSANNKKYLLELYQLLIIKQFVGKIVWYILAGILISSISYNLIISMNCQKTEEQMKKEIETNINALETNKQAQLQGL